MTTYIVSYCRPRGAPRTSSLVSISTVMKTLHPKQSAAMTHGRDTGNPAAVVTLARRIMMRIRRDVEVEVEGGGGGGGAMGKIKSSNC